MTGGLRKYIVKGKATITSCLLIFHSFIEFCIIFTTNAISPAQNQFDLELWYKVFFFTDPGRLDIAINDSG